MDKRHNTIEEKDVCTVVWSDFTGNAVRDTGQEKKDKFSNTNGEKWHLQCLKAYVFHRNQVRWNIKN